MAEPRNWRWALLLSLFPLGVALGLTLPRSPGEASPEVTFARDMSAHHTQAVSMSVSLFRRTADPALRLLTQDITLTQQAQIGQMSGWLMAWGRPIAGLKAPMAGMDRAAMGLASSFDERSLEILPVAQAERRFLELMRAHHVGGVMMAKAALKDVRRPEVRAFAERMVVAQTSELGVLDALLVKRGGASPEAMPDMPDMPDMPNMGQ